MLIVSELLGHTDDGQSTKHDPQDALLSQFIYKHRGTLVQMIGLLLTQQTRQQQEQQEPGVLPSMQRRSSHDHTALHPDFDWVGDGTSYDGKRSEERNGWGGGYGRK